jgi:3-methyladenine DNA glycosylase AlkD
MKMSELDQDLSLISAIMEAGETAEEQIERRIDFLVRELDEFTAMANNPETVDLIEKESIGIGQVRFRAQLILAFLEARKAPKLRMISNA